MSDRPTRDVGVAVDNLPEGIPFAGEIRAVLSRAYAQARENEDYWVGQGKPHLRTFLKTTPLGLAILDLVRKVNEGLTMTTTDIPALIARLRYEEGAPSHLWGLDVAEVMRLASDALEALEAKETHTPQHIWDKIAAVSAVGERIMADALKVGAERDEALAVISEALTVRRSSNLSSAEMVYAMFRALSRIPEHPKED